MSDPFAEARVERVAIAPLDQDELPGLSELVPSELEHAEACSPRRRREFVAGRAALRRALRACGADAGALAVPLLSGEQGRPALPPGFTGSITHKDGLALAVAAPLRDGRTLGIDSEVLGDRERLAIAPHVLRPGPLARWRASGGSWAVLLERFSVKEAVYKALHPHVPRFIGFHEAEVGEDGSIRLFLKGGEGPFDLRSRLAWEGPRVVALVAARPVDAAAGVAAEGARRAP